MKQEKTKSLLTWTIIFIALLGFLAYRAHAKNSAAVGISSNKTVSLAQCLTEKGVKMYGTFWCSHCQKQKEAFGATWQYINYIECSNPDGSQKEECQKAGLQSYPTWDFGNGTRLSGEISFSKLAEKANCPF